MPSIRQIIISVLALGGWVAAERKPINDGYGDSAQWRRWFYYLEDYYKQMWEYPQKWHPINGYRECPHKGQFPYHEVFHNLLDNRLLDCHMEPTCQDLETYNAPEGFDLVGHDKHDCADKPQNVARPIICSKFTTAAFPDDKKCVWRGDGGNCDGVAGQPGDVVLFQSRKGGLPQENEKAEYAKWCKKGFKYFTCPMPGFDESMGECRWENDCTKASCHDDEELLAYASPPSVEGLCRRQLWNEKVWPKFCCKKPRENQEPPFSKCYWSGLERPKGIIKKKSMELKDECRAAPTWGRGWCSLNQCLPNEVTIARDRAGDQLSRVAVLDDENLISEACRSNREKSLCCTPNVDYLGDLHTMPFYCRPGGALADTPACPSRNSTVGSDDSTVV